MDEEARAFGGKLTRGRPGVTWILCTTSQAPPTASSIVSKAFNQASPIAKTTNEARAGSLSGAATEEEGARRRGRGGGHPSRLFHHVHPPTANPPPLLEASGHTCNGGGALHSQANSTRFSSTLNFELVKRTTSMWFDSSCTSIQCSGCAGRSGNGHAHTLDSSALLQ